ncbi:MAG: RnfABCDGE type electron transport complex subunit G [Oscillospiraceae bacterium]|nr:RnfABCDGE type electron transport complex subunit G [Oscillospiraceae bacterium]
MSDTNVKTKQEPGIVQLAVILFAISAVCALLLGLVNLITADAIQKAKDEKTQKAMAEVLTADSYEQVEYTGGDALVQAVYQAGDAGYVVQVTPSGFGGVINMMVGVGTDGNVTGVSIISMSETSGLGTNAKKETFRDQYTGQPGPFSVTKDGGQINAITGATITSRAVSTGVNAAVDAVKTMG